MIFRSIMAFSAAVVVVVVGVGCNGSNPASPLAKPVITSQSSSHTVVVGNTDTLWVVATGNPVPAYQWKHDGVDVMNATSSRLIIGPIGFSDSGSYTVTATNSQGSVTSSAVVLTVVAPTELEGAWSGKNIDGIDQRQWLYVFRANTIVIDSITFGDTVEADSGTFTLDTMASPRSIDIQVLRSPNSQDAGETILARYDLSGNVLHITANAAGTPRPDSVAPPAPVISLFLQQ